MDVKIKAVIRGLSPKTRPIATPAKEECERVSPIIAYLFNTIKSPMQGHKRDIIKPARKAFFINSSSNILFYLSICE